MLASLALALPVSAAPVRIESPGLAYIEARAAQLSGDHARSAALFAALAQQSADQALTRKAVSTAITAGELALALRLIRGLDQSKLPIEAQLLLVADELRQGRNARAVALSAAAQGEGPNVSFLAPLIRAWDAVERKNLAAALEALDSAPANGLIAPFRDEHRALILLRFGRAAEAEPFVTRALGAAGGRRGRLRMVFADAFLRARDPQRALSIIEQSDDAVSIARIRGGKRLGQEIDSAADGFSELLTGLAVDLSRGDKDLPIGLLEIARYADPANSGATLLQGLLLDIADRDDAALATFRSVGRKDALFSQARDFEARTLLSGDRFEQALALVEPLTRQKDASTADWERLGEVLHEAKRYGPAADAFARAIALLGQASPSKRSRLLLARAASLEEADRWPEAKSDLAAALALTPDEPILLNFLGYAKLERGEDLDGAEAMIRKASALAPDEPSITDSLGWALFKRGRLPEAIETLQRAASKDAQQAEIHEHLGDALFVAGRRYEARFAWSAALITADEQVAGRIRAKLASGLTPASAAP